MNKKRISLITGSLIAFLVVFLPYLLYVHKYIPDEVENYNFLFWNIKGGHYVFAQVYVYFLFAKIVPFLLLVIWFMTNKHWWVHALIVPITIYLINLISIFNDSLQYVDEVDYIYSIPISTIIMGVLYVIRANLSIYVQAIDLKEEMDENMKIPSKFKDQ